MNKVTLIGRLGKNPEMRYLPNSGNAVTSFTLATNRRFTGRDGTKKEYTDWHNIECHGSLAEVCNQYLTKGKQIAVEGRLQTDSWTTEDGTKKYFTKVVINEMEMLGSRSDDGAQPGDGGNLEDAASYTEEEHIEWGG